jgi:hypothetical protein
LQRLKENMPFYFQAAADKGLLFTLGTHRKEKLRRSLGSLWDQTLLHPDVAKKHAGALQERLLQRFAGLWKPAVKKRLRWTTILHDAVPMDIEAIQASVLSLEEKLVSTIEGARGRVSLIGTVELEVIDTDALAEAANREAMGREAKLAGKAPDEFKRKLAGVQALKERAAVAAPKVILVHFHGLIDWGDDNPKRAALVIGQRLRTLWPISRGVMIKALRSNRSIEANLKTLGHYMAKGGNEDLRYKVGATRSVEASLWKRGIKSDPLTAEEFQALDPDGLTDWLNRDQGEIDELALTGPELRTLGHAIHWLMTRSGGTQGYLIDVSSTPIAAALPDL